MSKRFRYLVLATSVSLAMWTGIIAGSMAIFNSLAVFVSYDDFHIFADQIAWRMRDVGGAGIAHE